jgi:hypothetical protein
MGKRYLVMLLPLMAFVLTSTAYGWQGRMGGMGDPFGLVQDESDFLIHPAKIAKGEGVKFYGHYRFIYTGVTDWDYDLDEFNTSGTLTDFYHFNTSGDEYKHDALVGVAFPLGPGRMGLLFAYDGIKGNYDGNEDRLATSDYAEYDLASKFDNFALRLLYGLPVGRFKLGGEAQFAYRQEENETWWQRLAAGPLIYYVNQYQGPLESDHNLSPFMFPYDSSYWEALLKGSIEGKVGPLDLEFTLRGGFIFGGDNQLGYEAVVGPVSYAYDLNGGVNGWRIGGDLWVRYPVNDTLSVPLLVRIDYQEKTRDGDGIGTGGMPGAYEYENEKKGFEIEVGGGVNKEFNKGARIAAGVYYSYLDQQNDFWVLWTPTGSWQTYDHSDYPASIEHRVRLSLAGEREISPAVTLRIGINGFYGWVREDLKYTYTTSAPVVDQYNISLDGSHWGIGASVGGSVRFQRLTLEPFITAGYEELALDGDGDHVPSQGLTSLYEMDLTRRAWYIGGGFSVLFDL